MADDHDSVITYYDQKKLQLYKNQPIRELYVFDAIIKNWERHIKILPTAF